VGRLIPAGTGGMLSRLNQIATHRDELILEERQRSAQEAIEPAGEAVPEEAASGEAVPEDTTDSASA